MADNLYDTGAPKRVIVEHRHIHEVAVTMRRPEASWCAYDPGKQCIGGPYPFGEACAKCPLKPKTRVTIMPEFEQVTEKKLLK